MRRRAFLIAIPCALGAAVTWLAPGCLADLPAPTQCPPAAKHMASTCNLPPNPSPGCISRSVSSCLTGPRQSCECQGSEECPDDPAACYPPADCPPAVVAAVPGRKVTCIRLAELDLKSMLGPYGSDCLCGCPACASVCDGVGPVVAFVTPPSPQPMTGPAALFVDNVASYLPPSGQLGMYVRARGVPGTTFAAASAPEGRAYGIGIGGGSTDFSETVLWDEQQSPRWANDAGAPNFVAVVLEEAQQPVPSVLEIDCIVPFVVSTP